MLLSPVKCCGIWSLPWPDTLCLLMYSGTVWLMLQCVSAGTRSTKTFLLYGLYLQLWPVKSWWRNWMKDRTKSHCCEEAASRRNCFPDCPNLGSNDNWMCCVGVSPWPKHRPISQFMQRAWQSACVDMASSKGFTTQQHHQWCTFKIITHVRVLSRNERPWCWLLIASGRIRGYVS